MKSWTHLVYCNEVIAGYGPNYAIKAVQDRVGNWRCSDRKVATHGVPQYGQALTDVRILRERD